MYCLLTYENLTLSIISTTLPTNLFSCFLQQFTLSSFVVEGWVISISVIFPIVFVALAVGMGIFLVR